MRRTHLLVPALAAALSVTALQVPTATAAPAAPAASTAAALGVTEPYSLSLIHI